MIKKTSTLVVQKGPSHLKIFHEDDRPSSGATALVPLRDGREAGAFATAAYIKAAPVMHQLLCELNDHMHAHARHHEDCAVESTGECTCGLDALLIRTLTIVDQLERADEIYALGV